MFDQYDSIKSMNISDEVVKLLAYGKSQDILDKIKFIQNELKKNSKLNLFNLSTFIQDLLQKKNLEEKNNKYSEYNDVKENLFNILSKEEIDVEQKNNKELIKMDKDVDENKMEIEANPLAQNEEIEKLLMGNTQEEKKEEQLTGKKRARDKKKKDKEKEKEKDKEKEEDNNNKKKNKKRKVNNKENENNNINNNKGVKKDKDDPLKKGKKRRNTKENIKKLNDDALKNFLDNFHAKNDKNLRKKDSNSNSKKARKKETQTQIVDSKKNNTNNRTPKKVDTKKNPNKLIEDILKREFELGSKLPKQKAHIKTRNNISNQKSEEKSDDKDKNSTNNNSLVNSNIKHSNSKLKKKAVKKKSNNVPIVIDEELKKSTPIRNLKKKPKSILKKINLGPNPNPLSSTTPIKFQKAKSSEKKINLSSESKNKKFRTFAEIFQSPSKLKATPLKRRVNSEKKSNLKINSILTADDKEEKKDNDNKKRNISFNNERIVKEYNPKTPVRDVKQRITRKSPLERKNRNDLIN